MSTGSLTRLHQLRLFARRRFWLIFIAVAILLTCIISFQRIQSRTSRNRAAIVRKMKKVVRLEPILSAQEESSLEKVNSGRMFDEILKAEANNRRLLNGPVRAVFGCDEYGFVAFPDLSGLEHLDTLQEMNICPAYIPKSQLNRLPTSTFLRKLRMANYLTACSETCVVEAADTPPRKPEFAWESKDMEFLSRMQNLQELELRALWLRTGVLDIVADLPYLEVLSLNRSDFPCDELTSLHRLQNLRVMTFWNTPRAMRSLEWLREMDLLEELTLIGGGQIDAKMLEPLAQLPRLHTLRLDYGGLSDDAWPMLATFQNLRTLTLSYTSWFKASRFSTEETNSYSSTESSEESGNRQVAYLKQLEWLDVRHEHFYSAESLRALLATVPQDCRVVVNQYQLNRYLIELPHDIAGRLSGKLRPDLELPVEY